MQIRRQHDIQRGGLQHHAHGGGVDQHLVGLYVLEIRCNAGKISSHMTMAWRRALDLVIRVGRRRGRLRASLNAKRWVRSTAWRVNTATSSRHFLWMPEATTSVPMPSPGIAAML